MADIIEQASVLVLFELCLGSGAGRIKMCVWGGGGTVHIWGNGSLRDRSTRITGGETLIDNANFLLHFYYKNLF